MRPLRSPVVVKTLSVVFAAYLRLVFATLRWTRENQAAADGVWARAAETGAILCFWHARIPLSPVSWPQPRGAERQPMRALISRSADGEFIALAMQAVGFPSIRGSSQKATAKDKNKFGEQAFREMIAWVRGERGGVAVTPDGPRGPAEHMEKGVPSLARVSGAPVLLVGLACRPCLRLNTWDRTVVPLPFGRAAMVWDGPLHAGRGDAPEDLAQSWAARLTAVTDRAEALLHPR